MQLEYVFMFRIFRCVGQTATRAVLQGHVGSCFGCSFVEDGSKCVSWSGDSTLRLWDLATNETVKCTDLRVGSAKYPVLCCAIDEGGDGKVMCGGGSNEKVSFMGIPIQCASTSSFLAH